MIEVEENGILFRTDLSIGDIAEVVELDQDTQQKLCAIYPFSFSNFSEKTHVSIEGIIFKSGIFICVLDTYSYQTLPSSSLRKIKYPEDDLDKSCSCSINDLMIKGCSCGGK